MTLVPGTGAAPAPGAQCSFAAAVSDALILNILRVLQPGPNQQILPYFPLLQNDCWSCVQAVQHELREVTAKLVFSSLHFPPPLTLCRWKSVWLLECTVIHSLFMCSVNTVNFCENYKYIIKQQSLNLRPKSTYMFAYYLQKYDLMFPYH